ncbi:helix-turn-helix domain-containing protein [Janibacter limosus]|uniref:helix-turn-helix domain-containing protein n=1 Tax=Janibacter limosus TaxID=53458 RepID=UPI0035DA7DDE
MPQPNISAYENGRRRPTAEVLERIATALDVPLAVRLDTHRDAIVAAVTEHHAMHPRLFGSIARGDAGVGSDVDLLVDFTDEASLLDEVGLRLAAARSPRGRGRRGRVGLTARRRARPDPPRGDTAVKGPDTKAVDAARGVVSVCDAPGGHGRFGLRHLRRRPAHPVGRGDGPHPHRRRDQSHPG